MSDLVVDVLPRLITVDEFRRMFESGVFDADERLELLAGQLVTLPPIGGEHILSHARIVEYLVERLGAKALIAGQTSISLSLTDEPQPDISIFDRGIQSKPKSQ